MVNDNKWNRLRPKEKLELAKKHANMPYKEFAEMVGGVAETVRRFKVDNKINGLPQGAQPENKNAEFHGMGRNTIMRLAKRVLIKIGRDLRLCERCGLQNEGYTHPIHHKDEDRSNNDPSNLEVLCHSCHAIEHNSDRERDGEGKWLPQSSC